MNRRTFLKRGALFVPAAFAVQRGIGQGLTQSDGPFISAPNSAAVLPATNLVLKLESSQFDAQANGASVTTWTDGSGAGHNFAQGPISLYVPTVSATTLNGHKTLSFIVDGAIKSTYLASASLWLSAGATGLSVLCIRKDNASPPAIRSNGGGSNAGAAFEFTVGSGQPNTSAPYSDGNFYENFGSSVRVNMGTPGNIMASAFRKHKVIASSSSLKAYVDASNFFSNNSFATYQVNGTGHYAEGGGARYHLGVSISSGGYIQGFEGLLAAVYVWEKALSAAEQTALDAYVLQTWGI